MRIMRVDACDYAPLRSRGLRLILSDFVSELLNTQGLGFHTGFDTSCSMYSTDSDPHSVEVTVMNIQ
jgi:hypothetical protein